MRLSPGRYGQPRSAIVLRDQNGTLRAYLNECQHLPIPLDAGSGLFWNREGTHLLCSTHGAIYRPEDGYCEGGPCRGAFLRPLAFSIEGDELFVADPED